MQAATQKGQRVKGAKGSRDKGHLSWKVMALPIAPLTLCPFAPWHILQLSLQQLIALLLLAVSFFSTTVSARTEAEKAIRKVLNDQVEAWNEGNLEAFMRGYWNSPELTFQSGGQVIHGWEGTLDRYRRRYLGDGQEMGQLAFSDLKVELLGEEGAYVRGRFHLKFKNGKVSEGIFTLIFKRFADGWKIIHDHTSS